MVQICPACNAENRDVAKFCDQCGGALLPEAVEPEVVLPSPATAPDPPARPATAQLNWNGLLFLLAVVLAVLWIALLPTSRTQSQLGITTGAGGSGDPAGAMEDVTRQIGELRGRLADDPLDAQALADLYRLYGQIGEGEKVRPELETALAEVRRRVDSGTMVTEDGTKKLAEVALSALQGRDSYGAVQALKLYHELEPDNLGVVATIGNIYFDKGEQRPAIEWYEMYLTRGDPAVQGEDYWSVLVDKATMHLQLGEDDASQRDVALSILLDVTERRPEHWSAWYNLGMAYLQLEQRESALTAFQQAQAVGRDALQRWESEKQVAVLEGRDPPPMPNPHADGSIPMHPPGHP